MVKRILNAAGFVEGRTFKQTRFLKPPDDPYAVYMDSYERWGSDDKNFLTEHSYTIELYCRTPSPEKEDAIETALDNAGINYEKQERYWIQDEQLYQTIYSFDYIEK